MAFIPGLACYTREEAVFESIRRAGSLLEVGIVRKELCFLKKRT